MGLRLRRRTLWSVGEDRLTGQVGGSLHPSTWGFILETYITVPQHNTITPQTPFNGGETILYDPICLGLGGK